MQTGLQITAKYPAACSAGQSKAVRDKNEDSLNDLVNNDCKEPQKNIVYIVTD